MEKGNIINCHPFKVYGKVFKVEILSLSETVVGESVVVIKKLLQMQVGKKNSCCFKNFP